MNSKNEIFSKLSLRSKKSVAIIGSSLCSCLIGDYIKKKYGAKVVFYEEKKFIGGAWRIDGYGNMFSNIIAPTDQNTRKVFNKALIFLKNKKIQIKNLNQNSFYANQIVDTHIFNFNNFFNKIKKEYLFRRLKVKSLIEKEECVLVNNEYMHDYVLFPNSVNFKISKKKSSLTKIFKLPKCKIIKSKHIRIISKGISKEKLGGLNYSEQKLGPIDRLQIMKIRKNFFKISARISKEYKRKSKNSIIKNLIELLGIKNILDSSVSSYSSINYTSEQIKEINKINKNFNRIKHYNTSNIIGFISEYLL